MLGDYAALLSMSVPLTRGHKGCQAFAARWLREARFDESYKQWGGPDEEVVERARQAGLKIQWLDDGVCLHQWHPLKDTLAPDHAAYVFRRHANQARYETLRKQGARCHDGY